MKKRPWGLAVLLAVFAALLVFAEVQVRAVGKNLQYVVAAPAAQADVTAQGAGSETAQKETLPNQAIRDAWKSLKESMSEMTVELSSFTLKGLIQQTDLSSDNGGAAQGRMTLLGENALLLEPLYLRYGRLPYPEELEKGEKVMLLDEQLALKLFGIGDPVERQVTWGGATYRVVGILRHEKQVGDYTDYGAYAPLQSVVALSMNLDALEVVAAPISGTGAAVAFGSAMTAWQAGGTVTDLGKESMGATLWLRALLFLMGMTLTLTLIRFLNSRVHDALRDGRERLKRSYAARLLPRFTLRGLLLAAGYAVCLALLGVLMDFIIQPVYTFPEWVPSILVEWEDIAAAFWKVWQTGATITELRTPELLRLRALTLLMQVASAGAGITLALLWGRVRTREEKRVAALHTMFVSGIPVSAMETLRPGPWRDLGYVDCDADGAEESRTAVLRSMMRIVDARTVLNSLPGTRVDGSFVLEVEDAQIPKNNQRLLITCKDAKLTVEEAERACDLKMNISALTRLIYGTKSFRDFLEDGEGFDMTQRIPVMDGLFGHHLTMREHV